MSSDESGAVVVQTDGAREVRMSYRRGCRDYGIGVATAFFMATTVLAYAILYRQHVPDHVFYASVIGFVVFSLIGFVIILAAYLLPVTLYEFMEGEPDA